MINTIRKSKITKVIASYLAIQLVVQMMQPMQLWALTSGPTQPEFNSFTPIGTSDMVNLASGNFNYNIPIMDVGGYPLNLAYDSGITMDQEASWVGLGWNLNVGQIVRDVRGLPDDFDGDLVRYENDMKTNVTVGVGVNATAGYAGLEALRGNVGISAQYNNYEGITFRPTVGLSYQLFKGPVRVGADLSSSVGSGPTISPNVSISQFLEEIETELTSTVGISVNSRKGLEALNLGFSVKRLEHVFDIGDESFYDNKGTISGSGYVSFNNNTFTPTKRAGIENGNFTFSGSIGPTVLGFDAQLQVNGFGSYQDIIKEDKNKLVKAYGYENTEKGEGKNGVLDFNREKDRTFNKHTTAIPVTNYTYDLYAVQGQGINGMFRPHRSQVSYLYDHRVIDQGNGGSLGVKLGAGWNFFVGGRLEVAPSFGETGKWEDNNRALGKFVETENDNNHLAYEPSYFKMIGEQTVDNEENLYKTQLSGNDPMKLKITGGKFNRKTAPVFQIKKTEDNGTIQYPEKQITTQNFKRTKRDLRNQNIQKVTQEEAETDPMILYRSNDAIKHHTAGMKILKPDGSTYVYGEAAYNNKKVEATFDVSGRSDIDCTDGTVGFSSIQNNNPLIGQFSGNSSEFSDRYLNRITTPAYAHSYMLTSVLSSDYEDVDNNGPTPNDLGAYTLFTYDLADTDYKWRVPYDATKASYNEGLKSDEDDQKANYLYGEKELKYISKIETKTHVAIFHLSNREDARGAIGETNDEGVAGYMKKIDKISLYSKPEYDESGDAASAIKEAHFEYKYDLCKGVPNNLAGNGKLTLDKVYFTYRNSNMGKYTPYTFSYEGFNPDYNLKSYDIWGNYKPVVKEKLNYINEEVEYEVNEAGIEVPILNTSFNDDPSYCKVDASLVAPEFPFVQQDDKKLQDAFASAWTLTSIDLPSGGKLEMEYESDDYQYVQDRKAMQMFKVTGAHSDPIIDHVDNPLLYDLQNPDDHAEYIFAKLSDDVLPLSEQEFKDRYLGDQIDKPIQFRFLLQMVAGQSEQFDYVSGYFEIDQDIPIKIVSESGRGTYAAIPMKKLKREGGLINSNKDVNPITKAGWYFGRTYLNRQVYSYDGNSTNDNFEEILKDLVGSLGAIFEIVGGPNGKLQEKRSAMQFEPKKSWVRLLHPDQRKLGGGIRVKEIKMHDRWDAMTNHTNDARYLQFYGQQYTYNNKDGSSYGVATFEPNGSKENPFVEPFFSEKPGSENLGKDKLAAPQESNYTEKPFGESFFPSPKVTYSRVEVKNLPRTRTEGGKKYTVKKSATGKVITEMYTTKDYPTIVDYTDINGSDGKAYDQTPVLQNILGLGVVVIDKNHLTLSQGFTIETNDINGRLKRQQVFAEGQEVPISEVEYKYSVDDQGQLDNKLPVIDSNGKISTDKFIAMHYDVFNEFRENKSQLTTTGVNQNLTGFIIGIWPNLIPIPLPAYANHEQILRTATTTKVIHKSAILVEKIARDLGSEVSTKNLAWDAETGDILLTETINEFDDHYYNFKYPAHWYYDGMQLASSNIGISGTLLYTENVPVFNLQDPDQGKTPLDYFRNGDELMTTEPDGTNEKLWVIDVSESGVTLMNSNGFIINQECSNFTKEDLNFKIIRSGYRNQQMASMASVTSMINPIDLNNDGVLNDFSTANYSYAGGNAIDPKIVNASAVAYSDYWKPQKELELPGFPSTLGNLYNQIHDEVVDEEGNELTDREQITTHKYGFNPYLYNVRGDWRAIKSYAYLGGRNSNVEDDTNFSTASEGYFSAFNSFYDNTQNNSWKKTKENWTFASQVSKYSPYGAELENKDALDRYSAAQYGYEYTLPVAVGSNTEYREMGYDGFEDYKPSDVIPSPIQGFNNVRSSHFDFKPLLGDKLLERVERTDEAAHTGKYSLVVPGGAPTTTMMIQLPECETVVSTIRCATDGGGVSEEPNSNCFTRRKRVFLTGTANQTINYSYDFTSSGLDANECVDSKYLNVSGRQYTNNGGSGTIQLDSNGEKEFIVSGGATGYFGYGNPETVKWNITFNASNTVSVVLGDLCDDKGCNNGNPGGGTTGGNGN
ncbi:hypothetical protein [Aquimarina sp. 2201CG5-10]|uniref:hypothetical protein n=1 Tax=Aquimarina callyspongiae TaxID=3098150 RepID=UPI002AB3C8FE|nr:hypothetical protein [Aquimarina sp. 2201CG5-10]MDY8138480.1 hypothetical protein [Aquimarina sp. 2201CG5-10]